MEKILELFEKAEVLIGAGAVLVVSIAAFFGRIVDAIKGVLDKIRELRVERTQMYKTFKAKSRNTFQTACDDLYDGIETAKLVSIAKIKNGYKCFLPDSDAKEEIVASSGHEAKKVYDGKDGKHELDPAFYDVAGDSLKYGGALLTVDMLENQEYVDFLKYVGYRAIRIFSIVYNDEFAYFLYVGVENENPLTPKQKHLIKVKMRELKSCFSKKNFFR